jgi:tRNA(Ile)-lysidine synthase
VEQTDPQLDVLWERNLDTTGLVASGDAVVLAVSGGIDSMVMLHLFAGIADRRDLKLTVVHLNHQLRGSESDGDEAFVRRVSEAFNIPFFCKKVDTVGYMASTRLSKQEAARDLRYEFFEEVRLKADAVSVATAHQADDNAETVLMNALRGTGIRGLAGIPLTRAEGNIIRPLLFARRRDIERFARDHNIEFRFDSSNASIKYRRNFLRHSIIPMMESSSESDVVDSINTFSWLVRKLDALVSMQVRDALETAEISAATGEASIVIGVLKEKPRYLQEAIILEILRTLGAEVESNKVHRIIALCDLETGSVVQLSKALHVYRDRDHLFFVRPGDRSAVHQVVTPGDIYAHGNFKFSLSAPMPRPVEFAADRRIEYVDALKLGGHLVLRTWQDGDWFIPLGMNARKKVSDFFVDEKVPLVQKHTVPILESDGTIVWICGRRLDDRFKVTPETREVVRLEFNPTEHQS